MVGCGKKTDEPEQKPAVLSEENQKQQPAVLRQEEQKKRQKAIAEIKKLGGMVRRGGTGVELQNRRITDKDLKHLKGMTKLTILYLKNSQITDTGFKKLQKALPNCKIEHLPLLSTRFPQ